MLCYWDKMRSCCPKPENVQLLLSYSALSLVFPVDCGWWNCIWRTPSPWQSHWQQETWMYRRVSKDHACWSWTLRTGRPVCGWIGSMCTGTSEWPLLGPWVCSATKQQKERQAFPFCKDSLVQLHAEKNCEATVKTCSFSDSVMQSSKRISSWNARQVFFCKEILSTSSVCLENRIMRTELSVENYFYARLYYQLLFSYQMTTLPFLPIGGKLLSRFLQLISDLSVHYELTVWTPLALLLIH